MKTSFISKRNLGFFLCGMLWGLVLAYVAGGILLKKYLVLEYNSTLPVKEAADKIARNAVATGRWQANVSTCSMPQPSDHTNIRVITLCNAKIAKSIVDNYSSRKLASIIPCQIAVYKKNDGSTAISRLNFALIGSLCGGEAAKNSATAQNEQKNIMKDVLNEY
jgi:hypothetical protein